VILVDSSVWIDYFRGAANPHTDRLDALLGSELVVTGDLILLEVLQGFARDRDFDQARKLLTALPVLDLGGAQIAVQAAKHHRLLRTRGVTVRKTIDTVIATRCIEDRMPLLYADRDFDPFVEHLGLQSAIVDD